MKSRLEQFCSDEAHLLTSVDKLEKWTDFRDEVVAISGAIVGAQTQPTSHLMQKNRAEWYIYVENVRCRVTI